VIFYPKKYSVIFFDFDGVIKDSVKVKSDAFEQLFLPFGKDLAIKVRAHHEKNGGMARFEKFPIYVDWSGQKRSQQLINKYLEAFSSLVVQKVIESEWVPGIMNYLKENIDKKEFFLVTATPQKEIEYIVEKLQIGGYFKQVIGSPVCKENAIKDLLHKHSIIPQQAVMIGDSISDYTAAFSNNMPFILRRTILNEDLQMELDCTMISDFYDE